MFLEPLCRRNQGFVQAAVELHREGAIPPNSYLIDLDAVTRNAERIHREASRVGLDVFAMTKQVGRGAPFVQAVQRGGIDQAVAVDLQCARGAVAGGMCLGHIGHLVQMARGEASEAAELEPANWTVFNVEKAREAAAAAGRLGRRQDLLARVAGDADHFYRGHEGGFHARDAVEVAYQLDELHSGRFAGITTFPALLFDLAARQLRPTPNLATLGHVANRLAAAGFQEVRVNAPGTTSTSSLQLLADAGATQVEPGHGLTGTTPAHAFDDLVEEPAVLYLTEVTHHAAGRAYCLGGGFYVDPVFGDYDLRALVTDSPDPAAWTRVAAELPTADAIDYYAMLEEPRGKRLNVGATVVFGFRIQAFVARAQIVGLHGVAEQRPRISGVWGPDGRPVLAA